MIDVIWLDIVLLNRASLKILIVQFISTKGNYFNSEVPGSVIEKYFLIPILFGSKRSPLSDLGGGGGIRVPGSVTHILIKFDHNSSFLRTEIIESSEKQGQDGVILMGQNWVNWNNDWKYIFWT